MSQREMLKLENGKVEDGVGEAAVTGCRRAHVGVERLRSKDRSTDCRVLVSPAIIGGVRAMWAGTRLTLGATVAIGRWRHL